MRELQWWCAARPDAWTWAWTPIPGVWIFVAVTAVAYLILLRRDAAGSSNARRRTASAVAGLVLLWLTLDWPVGPLGGAYLTSVHSLQFVMLAMVVPAMLLYGVTDASLNRIRNAPAVHSAIWRMTHPPTAALLYTVVMGATHATPVLDYLMSTQLGSFVLDMTWFLAGIIFVWPIMCGVPERPRFTPPLRILYLFLGTVAHVFIAMWLLTAQYPVYATYELAGRIGSIDAITDQHLAGAVMLLIGSPIILLTITFIFFRWQGTGEEPAAE